MYPQDQGIARPCRRAASDSTRHLTAKELARRWNLSFRSLERWRLEGKGPPFMKLNGRCRYRIEDIEAFEQARMRDSLNRPGGGR
jgi:hypothetical protein